MSREPKLMWGDIKEDVADAEQWMEGATLVNNEQGVLCALRSIASSQLAIAKMMLRAET